MKHVILIMIFLTLLGSGCAESQSARPVEDRDAEPSAIKFSDVTVPAGLGEYRHDNGSFGQAWAPEIVGGGGAFFDFDGDGWPDLLLVGGGNFAGRHDRPIRSFWLFRNNGDGTFSDRTREAGLADVDAYGLSAVAADYDNDGDQDFFLTTIYENLLFRNDDGVFTEVGKAAGLSDRSEWSTAALFFDAERDGDLDLYVGNYTDWSPEKDIYCGHEGVKVYCTPSTYAGISSRYYVNNGDGTFTDRSDQAGFGPIPGKVFGVVEMDYDGDMFSDIYVAEDTERDLLYRNNGDGTFTERGVISGIAFDHRGLARAGMGTDAAVIDSSGEVTVIVGNFTDETLGVYRHIGEGIFQDRVAGSRLGRSSLMTLTFGLILFDVDLDTDVDLLTANGHVQTQVEVLPEGRMFRQPTQLYLNRGDGSFEEYVDDNSVLAERLLSRGAAYADYDLDGDLDVLVVENNGAAHLWRNDLTDGKYLRVVLEGSLEAGDRYRSSRDALGSRIVAVVDGLRMERRLRTGSSYLSQSDRAAVFGLGSSERVDSLLVYWPGGRIDRFAGVEGNREVRLVEGRGATDQLISRNDDRLH